MNTASKRRAKGPARVPAPERKGPGFFMRQAIKLATASVRSDGGGPFGCVIVRRGKVIARGCNSVVPKNDPTAHAEVTAIRAACRALGTFRLSDCELYTSCEPCPMCLAAIYWARIPTVYYASTRSDAAAIGFDDDLIYRQIPLPPSRRSIAMRPLLRATARKPFRDWLLKSDKTPY